MSFDTLAPHYRWMEFVLAGEKLQRSRIAFLAALPSPSRVLICGEGNGRFLVECQRTWPQASMTCVDSSKKMLSAARDRSQKSGFNPSRIEFVHADLLDWTPPPRTYELMVSHFFLDCFNPYQLELIIERLSLAARGRANWLMADFQVPSSGLLRLRASLILRLMYLFFRFAAQLPAKKLTPPDPLLERHGFALRERKLSEWGLIKTDWWIKETESCRFA